jgi:hypothetical protein
VQPPDRASATTIRRSRSTTASGSTARRNLDHHLDAPSRASTTSRRTRSATSRHEGRRFRAISMRRADWRSSWRGRCCSRPTARAARTCSRRGARRGPYAACRDDPR